jgi:hypothetical protein
LDDARLIGASGYVCLPYLIYKRNARTVDRYVPKGCPSFASAAPLTNTGIDDLKPRMVVEGSQRETGRITRAWKKKRPNARAFSWKAMTEINKSSRWRLCAYLYCHPLTRNSKRRLYATGSDVRLPSTNIRAMGENKTTVPLTSNSARFRILSKGGRFLRASSTLRASFVFVALFCSSLSWLAAVSANGPKCFDGGKFFSRASRGWIGS